MIGRYCNPKLTSPALKPIYSFGRHLTVVLNINSSNKFDFVAKYTSTNISEGIYTFDSLSGLDIWEMGI